MAKSTLVNPVAGLFFRPDHVVAAEAVFPSAGGNTTPDPETVVLHLARQSRAHALRSSATPHDTWDKIVRLLTAEGFELIKPQFGPSRHEWLLRPESIVLFEQDRDGKGNLWLQTSPDSPPQEIPLEESDAFRLRDILHDAMISPAAQGAGSSPVPSRP
jgi:hypothetical protein